MDRILQPELLDILPADDPAAIRSRRDLRWVNRLMGNEAWLLDQLRAHARAGDRVLEIGAGRGDLLRRAREEGVAPVDAIDLHPPPDNLPAEAFWHQADARHFSGWSDYSVILGSLVFHHFDDAVLLEIGWRIRSGARLILASEPVRRRRFRWLFVLFCIAIRAGLVTRYDGRVSIGAGFRGDELAHLLGLSREEWKWQVVETVFGAYRFRAERLE